MSRAVSELATLTNPFNCVFAKKDLFASAKTLLATRNVTMQNEMYGALAVLSIFLALFVKLLVDMLGPSKASEGKKVKKVLVVID